MYVPLAKIQRLPKFEALDTPVEAYNPVNELFLSVWSNWEVFPLELAGANQTSFDYQNYVLDRVGKSWQEYGHI